MAACNEWPVLRTEVLLTRYYEWQSVWVGSGVVVSHPLSSRVEVFVGDGRKS